jgi:microcystin-dependent protein
MGQFPTALPTFTTPVSTATLAAMGHTALHQKDQDEILAVATKIGTGSSTPSAGKVLRATGTGTSSWGQVSLTADVSGILPIANIPLLTIVDTVYPVGSIYTSVVSTNPGTLFGTGTWIAFGQGKVMVGINAAETEFDTVEETGGEKTHALTSTEMPSHTHTQDAHTHTVTDPTHTHTTSAPYTTGAGATGNGSGIPPHNGVPNGSNWGGAISAASTGISNQSTTATNQNTGGGGGHNNLQPYIVVYMWKRTA